MSKVESLVDGSTYWIPTVLMFLSLTAIEMIKTTGGRKYKRQRRRYTKQLESWVKQKALNCQHKLLLVKAERASINAKTTSRDCVKQLFDNAIKIATKSGFKQDAALANERAGKYLLECPTEEEWIAIDYLEKAHCLYNEWGAKAKVEQMESMYEFLAHEESSETGFGFHARAKFSAALAKRHEELNPMKSTRPSSKVVN